jgi:hypothetical protein
MLEALRISADIPPPVPGSSRDSVDNPEQAGEAPTLTELLQVSFVKAYAAHFTIFSGHFLSIHIKRLFRRPVNYWVDLRYVEPMPERVFAVDRPALWVTATLGLLSAIFFLVAWLSGNPFFWLSVAVPLLCATLIAALILAQRSKYRIVFCSRYGRIPWFELLVAKPRRRTVDAFIEALTNAVREGRSQPGDTREERLGAELREHRRLRDGGILSEAVYRSVKARLLKQHAGKEGPKAIAEEK